MNAHGWGEQTRTRLSQPYETSRAMMTCRESIWALCAFGRNCFRAQPRQIASRAASVQLSAKFALAVKANSPMMLPICVCIYIYIYIERERERERERSLSLSMYICVYILLSLLYTYYCGVGSADLVIAHWRCCRWRGNFFLLFAVPCLLCCLFACSLVCWFACSFTCLLVAHVSVCSFG